MKTNWINILLATAIIGLLSWWLWILGINTLQKWLLACVGGFVMEVGLVGAMGFSFKNKRSGIQTKIVCFILMFFTFLYSIIFSFFTFSPESYCIPIGVFCIICCYIAYSVYKTKE